MHFIEPEDRHQISLFSTLDDFVAPDNPVRLLDLLVEQIVLANPEEFHRRGLSNVGRKAYSPQVLLKLFLYGYLNRISSSRKLEAETKRNMELMWLLGRLSPDHKTISDYRKNHSEAIHFLTLRFRDFLIDGNYIVGRQVALDGTKIRANAARQNFLRTKSLEKRIKAVEKQLEAYLDQLQQNDVIEDAEGHHEDGGEINQALVERICELEEELQALRSDKDRLDSSPLKEIHRSDPECRMMRSPSGFFPAYNLQMVTDMSQGMIAHAEIRQENSDQGLTEEIIDNLEMESSIVPEELFADTAYFSIDQLHWLEVDRGIKSWIPVPETDRQKKDKEAGIKFSLLPQEDAYQCSEGKLLPRKQIHRRDQVVYYKGKECGSCKIKSECTQAENRSIQIPFRHLWLGRFRKRMRSYLGKEAMRKRKAWAEHPFGTLKIWMGKIPLLLRGRRKVQTEIDLYTTAYNFKRILAILKYNQIAAQFQSYLWIGE